MEKKSNSPGDLSSLPLGKKVKLYRALEDFSQQDDDSGYFPQKEVRELFLQNAEIDGLVSTWNDVYKLSNFLREEVLKVFPSEKVEAVAEDSPDELPRAGEVQVVEQKTQKEWLKRIDEILAETS